MNFWYEGDGRQYSGVSPDAELKDKYQSFKDLLFLNNEGLEFLSKLQEDLQYVPPFASLVGGRVELLFDRADRAVAALNRVCEDRYHKLHKVLKLQRRTVEGLLAAREEQAETRRLAAWLSEIDLSAANEVGGKAAALGEVRNKLDLPVPDGYVLTTEAYRRFCGIPLWESVRDEMRDLDAENVEQLEKSAEMLIGTILGLPLPRALEVALHDRAGVLLQPQGFGLAVRSSAVGEGGERSFAGQFESILNVPMGGLVSAYKRVVASRFSARALSYRISRGIADVESPMGVLFLPTLDVKSAGIMYSRNPKRPRGGEVLVTGTLGLGLDIAGGQAPADLFVLSRSRDHALLEQHPALKSEFVSLLTGGGLARSDVAPDAGEAPCLGEKELRILAAWAVRLESHFKSPQDVEWALDRKGDLWILQTRPLILAAGSRERTKAKTSLAPLLSGGLTIYPGRTSGPAYVADEARDLGRAPDGSVLFLPRPTPEIVKVIPKTAGLVAEKGSIAGHAAALLREFKVPSVFQAPGYASYVKSGDPVSLDAVQAKVYEGILWPPQHEEAEKPRKQKKRKVDAMSHSLLALHLVDPDAFNFRPGGCKSVHDVLRFAHERAIETMFSVNDRVMERGVRGAKKVVSDIPMELYVLDLGGGLFEAASPDIGPDGIVSRPFRALWKGISHPGVTWSRSAPPSLGGFASVLAGALTEQHSAKRALGDTSYLLVGDEYMNLNARMAYHFSMIDALMSDTPNQNYIVFRFAGGGASRRRRGLRACFIQIVLGRYGYQVDRRGDLVNAWIKKASAVEMEEKLDILGRLIVCASQLDMYMNSQAAMRWYVDQFMSGNYDLRRPTGKQATEGAEG